MGFFDLPFPIFSWLDGMFRDVLPAMTMMVFWAFVGSAVSMLLYRLVSKQKTIAHVGAQASEARHALMRYDGEFEGFLPLVRKTLSLSARQLRLTAGPAVIASLPLLSLMAWLSLAYGYTFAEPGSVIRIRTDPEAIEVNWAPADARRAQDGTWLVSWPSPGQTIRLSDAAGVEVLSLPPSAPVTLVHKRRWWNVMFGNPAGYLPDEGALDSVELDLPEMTVLGFGPDWMRTWESAFFTLLVLWSFGIKIAFRIK
ncbi:MAG: hypothetical protein V3S40_00895 [Kiloniellales bacterium]